MARMAIGLGRGFVLAGLLGLAACANEVPRQPVALVPAQQAWRYVVMSQMTIELDSGNVRSLPVGTEFAEAGSISQGKVLRPVKAVFNVEGAGAQEAYPVVRDSKLVGFYLPIEKSYSPLSRPVAFPLQELGTFK